MRDIMNDVIEKKQMNLKRYFCVKWNQALSCCLMLKLGLICSANFHHQSGELAQILVFKKKDINIKLLELIMNHTKRRGQITGPLLQLNEQISRSCNLIINFSAVTKHQEIPIQYIVHVDIGHVVWATADKNSPYISGPIRNLNTQIFSHKMQTGWTSDGSSLKQVDLVFMNIDNQNNG